MEFLDLIWRTLTSDKVWYLAREFVQFLPSFAAEQPILAGSAAVGLVSGALWGGIFLYQDQKRRSFNAFDETDVRHPAINGPAKGMMGLVILMAAAVGAASIFYGDFGALFDGDEAPTSDRPIVLETIEPEEPAPPVFGGEMTEFTIYFAKDDAELNSDAQSMVTRSYNQSSELCQELSGTLIANLEGHDDQQSERAVAFQLGQARADATRSFLVSLGMDPKKISSASYGRERPAHPVELPQNRRVEGVFECAAG